MSWEVHYNNEQVKVFLSEILKNECKIYFKIDDSWQEMYCGSIDLLKNFHKAYIAVCEILGREI